MPSDEPELPMFVADDSQDQTQSFFTIVSGTKISHYRIVEKIGAGGMGEVYLAQDTELDRKVALKFLPPHLCQDEDCRKRFKREAQAAAKLSHPNIIHVYEVSEYQGRPFFAMEHVEGRSLRDIKAEELDIDRIVGIAIQLCDGLHTAHVSGVTHRDIKPSNIIIDSSGRPKLLDFGLATVKGSEHLTKTGSTLGTVGYMSPEQIEGKATDARSDLFSLGVVLYELIANKSPFRRSDETATLKAILQDTPEPLARYKSGVSDDLQRIISKLLEKDPTLRYQSAPGVIPDLKKLSVTSTASVAIERKRDRWNQYVVPSAVVVLLAVLAIWHFGFRDQAPSGSSDDKRIMLAVLPFENLGGPEDEYFADGITDEITSKVSILDGLGVIARTSILQYKGTTKRIVEIGSELNVDYILEGTIRWDKSGEVERIRITPQLIRVSDETHLWSDNIQRDLSQIFEVQEDIATSIARALNVTLLTGDQEALDNRPTDNLEAYSKYLRATALDAFKKQSCLTSLSLLSDAIQLDSSFALAYAELSFRMSAYHYHHAMTIRSDTVGRAAEYARKAIGLDPKLPAGYRALGQYYYWVENDFDLALQQFGVALDLNPNNSEVLWSVALVNRKMGRWEEALEYFEQANILDPSSFDSDYLQTMYYLKRYGRALSLVDNWLLFHPDSWPLRISRAYILGHLSNDLNEFVNNIPDDNNDNLASGLSLDILAHLRFMQRDYEASIRIMRRGRELATNPLIIALYHVHLGQVERYLGGNSNSVYSDSAIQILESLTTKNLNRYTARHSVDAIASSALALACGQKGDTLRARLLVDVALRTDVDKYDWSNAFFVKYFGSLALITIGDFDQAIDLLEELLSMPSFVSLLEVKYEPHYDPLRDHPRFQALIEKYEKKYGT